MYEYDWVSVNEKLPKAKMHVWLKRDETDAPVLGMLKRSKADAEIYGVSAPFWETYEQRYMYDVKVFKDKDYFTHWAMTESATWIKT